jgi:hypothetical protein
VLVRFLTIILEPPVIFSAFKRVANNWTPIFYLKGREISANLFLTCDYSKGVTGARRFS